VERKMDSLENVGRSCGRKGCPNKISPAKAKQCKYCDDDECKKVRARVRQQECRLPATQTNRRVREQSRLNEMAGQQQRRRRPTVELVLEERRRAKSQARKKL
jgi:hypothetical protein